MNTIRSTISSQPSLGDLLDLARQMQSDAETSASGLRHRDRRIGRDLTDLAGRPVAQLLGWLDRIRRESDELRGDRVNVLHRLGLLVLALAGALAGWGAAAVVFRYDGTHPVNVIHVLAVFVVLQLVALVFFAIGLLPPAVTRFLPGMSAVQDALRLLSPGRLQHLLTRYLPQRYRETSGALLGKGRAHQRLYGRVDRWVVAHSSQTFAVFFNLGALASCLYLVTFSDLAFSWSTTLQVEPVALARWTDILSTPWAAFFGDARPSFELIEATRYFRFKDGGFPATTSPAGLGGWWPFLVMCMVTYGLLPRLLTWGLARRRLRAATRQTFLHFPGAPDLLARLNSELVETRAEQPEVAGAAADAALGGATATVPDEAVRIVDWAAAVEATAGRAWLTDTAGLQANAWHEAGGARSPQQDRQTAAAIGRDGHESVVVLVKAWEPPMAEFLDFMQGLRRATTPERSLLVAPLGRTPAGQVAAAEPAHLEMWRSVLVRLGDPWLRVLTLGGDRA